MMLPKSQQISVAQSETLTVKAVARRLGKGDQFVRELLKRGLVPWGQAIKNTRGGWNYIIYAARFEAYLKGEL